MRRRTMFILPLTVLVLLLLSGIALAQVGSGFDLSWHVVASGGGSGTMAGSGFTTDGTISQNAIGPTSDATFTVQQGFWYGVEGGGVPSPHTVYLPVIYTHVNP